jgi:hypothetical protein
MTPIIPLLLAATLGLGVLATAAAAAPLVSNSDFTRPSPADKRLPESWTVPPGSLWQFTDADGHGDQYSLCHASTAAAPTLPVTQALTLPAKTPLVLLGALKAEGGSRPVIRLRWAGDNGAELVRLVGEGPAGVWRRQAAEFNTGPGGPAILELWTDLIRLHSPERNAPAGRVAFDEVQILSQAEAQAQHANQPGIVTTDNLARGKPYTLQPPPGYPHCTDPDDRIQLTDGQYTVGYFWTQKSTVGWVRMQDLVITLDLGEHYPLRGLSFNSAAGVAGVKWPAAIRVLVSVDGRAYHELGDLLQLSTTPPAPDGTYTVQRFHTEALQTHGRYVKLLITPVGNCTFVDEIEVYRGEEAWKQLPLPGRAVNYPPEYFDADPFTAAVKRRIGQDLETVRTNLEPLKLPAPVAQRLARTASTLDAAIREVPVADAKTFHGVLPFNPVHERVYALQGAAWAALNRPPLVAWRANPWDYLTPTELPANPPPPALSVAAMQGETRACTLNLTNCTSRPMTVSLSFEGFSASPLADKVTVHDVAWTDTPASVLVAAALPELTARDGRYELTLPAGMTRQVWFSVTATGLSPGIHRGALIVAGATAQPLRVPFTVRVFDLQFPAQPRLHVGGWDYTDANLYGVTPQNRGALLAHLQSRFVDSPWATSGALPIGEFTATGQYAQPPPTRSLDRWVRDWPAARRYHVFCRVDAVAEPKLEDPLFAVKVGTWIRYWVAHLKTLGIGPERLFLLLVDESGSEAHDRTIIAWARAIKAAEPAVAIWDDGTRPPERMTPELLAAVDYLCPHRPSLLAETDDAPLAIYRQQRAAGKGLYLYSCWGPTRTLDPYAYYRLQAWSAFQMGAEGSFFWAFGSNAGGSSWNDYVPKDTSFTPLFMTPDSVTAGKHMEAIRESVGDFEYLSMLRDRVAELEQRQPRHPLLPRARALLASAADRVLSAPGATIAAYEVSEMRWPAPRDRNLADVVRIEVAEMLEKLR